LDKTDKDEPKSKALTSD